MPLIINTILIFIINVHTKNKYLLILYSDGCITVQKEERKHEHLKKPKVAKLA